MARFKVMLQTGELLREFEDKTVACQFSEQVYMIGKRKNRCIDTVTGKTIAHFE